MASDLEVVCESKRTDEQTHNIHTDTTPHCQNHNGWILSGLLDGMDGAITYSVDQCILCTLVIQVASFYLVVCESCDDSRIHSSLVPASNSKLLMQYPCTHIQDESEYNSNDPRVNGTGEEASVDGLLFLTTPINLLVRSCFCECNNI